LDVAPSLLVATRGRLGLHRIVPPSSAVAAEIEALKQHVRRHRAISTPFGVFWLHRHPASEGLEPMSGGRVAIVAKTRVHFAPSDRFALDAVGEAAGKARRSPRAQVFRVRAIDAETGETLAAREIRVDPEEPLAPPDSAVTLECDALYRDVLDRLGAKRAAKYSGFGNFAIQKDGTLEFAPSQVWKAEVVDAE